MEKHHKVSKAVIESEAVFLTTKDLSERWRVTPMFLHRLRAEGRLRSYRIGKRGIRFAAADILKLEAEAAS